MSDLENKNLKSKLDELLQVRNFSTQCSILLFIFSLACFTVSCVLATNGSDFFILSSVLSVFLMYSMWQTVKAGYAIDLEINETLDKIEKENNKNDN